MSITTASCIDLAAGAIASSCGRCSTIAASIADVGQYRYNPSERWRRLAGRQRQGKVIRFDASSMIRRLDYLSADFHKTEVLGMIVN